MSKAAATREDQLQNERGAATRTEEQQSQRATEAKPGGVSSFGALDAAQLLLEADKLATRRFAADGNNCALQHALRFRQQLLPAPASALGRRLLPTAAGQQLASAPVGVFLPAASEPQLPASLGVPTVKQQLPTAPTMMLLDPAVKRKLPADAQGLQVGSAEPPAKRSREGAKALHNAAIQSAAAANMAYEELAFL